MPTPNIVFKRCKYPKNSTIATVYRSLFLEILNSFPGAILCFTYGSKIGDRTGFAYSISDQIFASHEVYFTRLRIGHTRITHAHLLSNLFPLSCEHCSLHSPLIVEHMFECPALIALRLLHHVPHSLRASLSNDSPPIPNLFSYLHAANFLSCIDLHCEFLGENVLNQLDCIIYSQFGQAPYRNKADCFQEKIPFPTIINFGVEMIVLDCRRQD